MRSLSKVIPLATGNLSAWTARLWLVSLQVKFLEVIRLPEKRPNAAWSVMKKVVVSLIVARLSLAERSWSRINPNCVSVVLFSIHEMFVFSVNMILAGNIPVLKTLKKCLTFSHLQMHEVPYASLQCYLKSVLYNQLEIRRKAGGKCTYEPFWGWVMVARSTWRFVRRTTNSTIARRTGNRTMNRRAIPSGIMMIWEIMNQRFV